MHGDGLEKSPNSILSCLVEDHYAFSISP